MLYGMALFGKYDNEAVEYQKDVQQTGELTMRHVSE
ncbi:predicted protein [Sclerotinia sclerotiorum 1980 UF-70]|uniref:Uncharacterized protein n=1 Tax=Sclerotinia sclerotiorum (strain ATCC 18683 / 1980 / Ss-1) TaxID=665079 RepID=A7EYT3_SCLS1|nr:predicted protein [Sclerotinia sclerotiorum 1980 UF-70]EDN94625.1 predicted protein [Sclerotinia sclerotiorum 1980 UF-70]